ncbi:MAG: hypothetical protein P8P36_08710 [Akkermansiaceae bacterium]|nr:hypothetical protein [Akkermansiaceae bacterium]
MALHEPWSIKSRAHVCAVSERHFEDGESFCTAIFPDPESSGYLRKDFSTDAWEQRAEDELVPFSFWQSVYRAPVKEEEIEVTEESPEDLLRRLIEEDEEHTENVRYILAVMLERKKQLVEVDNQPTATGIIRIYEHRKSGDVFIVKDPNIPLSEVENIQDEITIMLETGGRIPEPELPVDSEPIPDSQTESEPAPTDEDNENSSETLVNSSSEEE